MLKYSCHRLLGLIPTLFGITVLSFLLMQLAPGGPIDQAYDLNPRVSAEMKTKMRHELGLDQPWHMQYVRWVGKMARLDFGTSFKDNRPVLDKIKERLPATLLLNFLSLGLILFVAIPLGVYAAVHRRGWFDKLTTLFVFVGFSLPSYALALWLMLLFGLAWGILPISGLTSLNFDTMNVFQKAWDLCKHLVLPVFVLAFGSLAGLSRYSRTSMMQALKQDFVRTARAKGLPENVVIWKHAFRNALLPMITLFGLMIPDLIGGSVIIETIFAYPGMGRLGFEGIVTRDYSLVMAIVVISAVLTLLGNLLADLLYAVADPRIRHE